MDISKLTEAFLSETQTHIKSMNDALVTLEKKPDDTKLFHEVFRTVHTVKSLAATMNYQQMVQLCHAMEDLLTAVRNNIIPFDDCTDILFECFDRLSESLQMIAQNKTELNTGQLVEQLKYLLSHGEKLPESSNEKPTKQAFHVEKIQSINVKVDRLDILMNLAEELLVTKMRFDIINEQLNQPDLSSATEHLGRLITDLQYYVLQVRLVPIGFVFTRFARLVRDLARLENKKINLEMQGSEIELDRLLIDELGASIAHLIKNAVDHGIEKPEDRVLAGKPPEASIMLRATRTHETAIIEVSDDGAGLDIDEIKKLGLERHLFTKDASEEKMLQAIFSGLSTSKRITSVSGRGLGLAIVKQKIESIGGSVKVKSVAGRGTTFFIEIPLTLAIIRTLFVKVADEIYAIPTDSVERLLVATQEDFKGLLSNETIIYDDRDIPVIRLTKLFALPHKTLAKQPIVILRKGNEYLGLAVDSLLSTQEVVIKPLSRYIKDNEYFSGAALIGSGKMVLIIDSAYLLSTKKAEFNLV